MINKSRIVTLLKSGNRLVVNPTTDKIRDLLTPILTFTEKRFLQGWELKQSMLEGRGRIEYIDWECFGEDLKYRISTSFGFWQRIYDKLTKAGYTVKMRDLDEPKPGIYEPQWDDVFEEFNPRHGQADFLVQLMSHPCGRFDCPTGYGKSFMLGLTAKLLPKARIDIVSKSVSVCRDRIYPELCGMLPDVGMCGGGMRKTDRRVMIYTAGSLHQARGDADILIGDECHELATDVVSSKFARYDHSRNYGLSASHDMRLDNKDLRVEGIFGPLIYRMNYEEAKNHGMIVPIEVHWRPVIMDYDICEGTESVEKEKLGIWTNDYRNSLIAKDANLYDDDTQVLIVCRTIEHLMHLKRQLPHFTIVHREDALTLKDRAFYIKHGFITDGEPYFDLHRRRKLTKQFERGKLKKVICTTVWNVGVSFNHLAVLIRGDAGGSPIGDTQIPGRVSRIADGKEVGIVHDYMDQFNSGFRRRAVNREKSYEGHKWKQIFPDRPKKGSLRDQLLFGFDD